MAGTTQRDVMRKLDRRIGSDVKRASNVQNMESEECASRLYADGVKKGWMW